MFPKKEKCFQNVSLWKRNIELVQNSNFAVDSYEMLLVEISQLYPPTLDTQCELGAQRNQKIKCVKVL